MIVPRLLRFPAALLSALVLFSPARAAETVSLQPSADTSLMQVAPQNNLGGADFFNAGTSGIGTRNRALLFFDLGSAIPAGAVITGAELSMEVVHQPGSGQQNSFFSLRRMFRSWGEGAQTPADPNSRGFGAPAAPGEAAWDFRFAPDVLWTAPGGGAGTDFSDDLSATALVSGVGQPVLFESTGQLVVDLQRWLDQPQQNFGWMLKTESETTSRTARSFASRESGFGPVLTVTFEAVPEPGVISLVSLFLIGCGAVVRRGRRAGS